jgi:hypothetical protein
VNAVVTLPPVKAGVSNVTQAQRSAGWARAPATRKRSAAERTEHEHAGAVERTSEFSDEALKSLESGPRAAIEAGRKFLDTVDQALPPREETPARRQKVIDAAMEIADQLVHVQYEFLRKVVMKAGTSPARSEDGSRTSTGAADRDQPLRTPPVGLGEGRREH